MKYFFGQLGCNHLDHIDTCKAIMRAILSDTAVFITFKKNTEEATNQEVYKWSYIFGQVNPEYSLKDLIRKLKF